MNASENTPTAATAIELERLTPVLIVDAVEPCVRFWADRLGFTIENEVPGPDGTLVFASVKRGDVEIMYQTRASVLAEAPDAEAELPAIPPRSSSSSRTSTRWSRQWLAHHS